MGSKQPKEKILIIRPGTKYGCLVLLFYLLMFWGLLAAVTIEVAR